MKHEKGNWPAQNTKAIASSIRRVLTHNDITKLTRDAYNHLTLHQGFIAHYDLAGFHQHYSNVSIFARFLLTSEYTNDLSYNQKDAERYLGKFFIENYGKVYCESVVATNKMIVELAKQHLPRLQQLYGEAQKNSEIAELKRLADKHGVQLT